MLQATRKVECMAHIYIKSYGLYPDFAIGEEEKEGLTSWELRCLKKKKLVKKKLGPILTETVHGKHHLEIVHVNDLSFRQHSFNRSF